MPRIKTFLCSGMSILYITALTAQVALPKNKTLSNVVGYQIHQQKQWSYNQLPKNSIQYRSDPKYIPLTDRRISSTKLSLSPVKAPEVKKSFSESYLPLQNNSKFYLQNSRFLKYMWPNQSKEQSFLNNLGHSL